MRKMIFSSFTYTSAFGKFVQDNGKENGDEIAIETVKSKRKRRLKNRLKKYELHGDNEKKNGSESCCYGSDRNGDETAIGKIKPKQKRRLKSHEAHAS